MPFLSLLAACTGEPELASDYELTLLPSAPGSQLEDILALEPAIKIRLVRPDEDPELFYAGVAVEGEALELPDLPAVPAGTVVGLIVEQPGGPEDEWNRTATIAYGEAVVTEQLGLGGEQIELPIAIARVESPGRLGALANVDRRVLGAVARIPGADGSILLFGGGNPEGAEVFDNGIDGPVGLKSTASVLELARTADGWASVPVEVGTLPLTWHGYESRLDADGVLTGRNVGMSATPVTIDGRPMVLLVGGRYTLDFTPYTNSWWYLWDPQTHEVAGGGADGDEGDFVLPSGDPGCVAARTCGTLWSGRSEHIAIPLGPSKVLVYGGLIGLGLHTAPAYEIWNANTRESVFGDENLGTINGEAPFYMTGAPLGTDAVVCGGASWSVAGPDFLWTPSNQCFRFSPADDVDPFASLPVPIAGAAMAPLPDGGLLIAGGFDVVLEETQDGTYKQDTPATSGAWRWDPQTDAWRAVGDLVEARAFHRAVPLADGRVLMVGGTEIASMVFGPSRDAVRCSEVFDPATDSFSRTGCNDAGSGAFPAVGGDPVTGYAVLQGVDYTTFEGEGGGVFGLVGGQPAE